ncbi:MAG: MFS transporter [Saprospiraceae bacterium]|nr:MFS transporter [Saprospiraceae bacterium]
MLSHLSIFFMHKKSMAVGTAFFIMGFLFGNWATLIPFVKSHYQIDDAELGLILLSLPLGAMFFNPLSPMLIHRFGLQKMTVNGMFFISIAYMIPLCYDDIYLVPAGLILIGITITLLNIAANTLAAALEKTEQISIMSTCHGLFSLGLMIGSLMRSVTLLFNISEKNHMFFIGFCGISASIIVLKTIIGIKTVNESITDKKEKFKLILPHGALLTMIIISICINVTEGSMADWASLYMKEIVQTNPYFIGWGIFGYSAFMAIGRFFGDGIIPVYGRNNILKYGATLSFVGLLTVIIFPFTWTSILGFAFVGLGVSCGSPILYAAAANYPGIPKSGGLALMNTFAMTGFLAGPVIIGFISENTSLPVAFGFVAALAVLWFIKSIKVIL